MTGLQRITIAVDAMGGDLGPRATAEAVMEAVRQDSALSILLVGQESVLGAFPFLDHPRIRIVDAPEVVAMDERPSQALRRKTASSMAVAMQQVREGRAQGCVSAGNTGALMTLGRSILRMYPGIERPAIIKRIPSLRGRCHVLDLGANVDASAESLYQFAVMGALMVEVTTDTPQPRVALLNVGTEPVKGNEQVRLAGHLLEESETLRYVGYVEGHDLFEDKADVVVCDGFVGNIALKTGEGVAKMLMEVLDRAFRQGLLSRLVGLILRPFVKPLLKQIDPARHNGASFLGLQGVLVKSHGSADSRAWRAAIAQAAREARERIPERIGARLEDVVI